MPNCMVCNKSMTAGFVVCGDCAAKLKEQTALKPLYLVFREGGRWVGGYDGGDLRPLFGGNDAELGTSLRSRMATGEYGHIHVVSSEELNKLRSGMGLEQVSSLNENLSGMGTVSALTAWTLTDDDMSAEGERTAHTS